MLHEIQPLPPNRLPPAAGIASVCRRGVPPTAGRIGHSRAPRFVTAATYDRPFRMGAVVPNGSKSAQPHAPPAASAPLPPARGRRSRSRTPMFPGTVVPIPASQGPATAGAVKVMFSTLCAPAAELRSSGLPRCQFTRHCKIIAVRRGVVIDGQRPRHVFASRRNAAVLAPPPHSGGRLPLRLGTTGSGLGFKFRCRSRPDFPPSSTDNAR